jgi:hypothetical protein
MPFWQPDPENKESPMDRSDASQEGRTLPPIHQVELIARDEISRALANHVENCPMQIQRIPERLHSLEMSVWKLTGFMLGSGLLGGLTGALASKILR